MHGLIDSISSKSILFLSISVVVIGLSSSTLASESGEKQVCVIEKKETKSLAKDGSSETLVRCKSDDVLVFGTEGANLELITVAMGRVCNVSTIELVNRGAHTYGTCVFSGNVLKVISR